MVEATAILRDVEGVSVGHTTDAPAKTGCTVIAFDKPMLTAAEVRGAAPGTRELDLLAPGRTVQRADAILLTGGSAFGLRAADGVMQALRNLERGVPTPAIPVPIVPTAVIFDLANVHPEVPGVDDGATAFRTAVPLSQIETGSVGVGSGARWGGILGPDKMHAGGFGAAQIEVLNGTVTAFCVVNAFGVVAPEQDPRPLALEVTMSAPPLGQNTTLICVVTDITCTHDVLTRLCIAAHDALARVIWPSHTVVDGDVAFASTTNDGNARPETILPLTLATELAVEKSLRVAAGVEHEKSGTGFG